jgi:hypothetical protein
MTISIRNAPGYALTRPAQVTKVRKVVGYALTSPSADAVVTAGDTDYRKPRAELLFELLLKSNPKLTDFSMSSLSYSAPTALAISDLTAGGLSLQPDTSVVVSPSGNGDVSGKVTVKYRRIDLTKLFKGRNLTLVVPWVATSVLTKAEFISLFAEQYGVQFHDDDFSWGTTSNANYTYAYAVQSSSLCWKGSITVTTVKGKRNISEFVGDRVLNARIWPQAMIDFQDGSKPQGELLYYHLDFSSQRSDFSSWTADYVYNGAGSGSAVIAGRINAVAEVPTGIALTASLKVSTQPGIDNIKLMRYALPNPAVPEANSDEYKWCLVLIPQEPAWFHGKLILHYN